MVYIITPKVMDNYEINRLADRDTRRELDIRKGLSKAKGGQRGDYKLCHEADKILKDYRTYKNPNDRKKIENEYFGLSKEFRKGD